MRLYHYDHCPFCIRVRLIAGWKNIPLESVILRNSDEKSHFDLIGAKIVPILEKDDGSRMKESLDITAYLNTADSNPLLQDRPEDYNNSPLESWLAEIAVPTRFLVHPRNVQIGLEEFTEPEDIAYYTKKKSERIGPFAEALAKTLEYRKDAETILRKLPPLMTGPYFGSKPSYADILLFPVLRNLSIVKGLQFPESIREYMNRVSAETQVDLYFDRAV